MSQTLVEASLCWCQEVQEYPRLLICLLGSPSLLLLFFARMLFIRVSVNVSACDVDSASLIIFL